ncbi:MAG: hypothetical protein Q8P41_01550, partial [Pseudomonadota bacterium]|nr:hypothetical protein [Pseudomonadota bacterium]
TASGAVLTRAATLANGGAEVTADTVGAAGRLGQVAGGLATGARVLDGVRGGLDVARGVNQIATHTSDPDQMQAGSVRTAQGVVRTLGAAAGPAGAAVATAGNFAIEGAGDDVATRRRGWLGGDRGGSGWAADTGRDLETQLAGNHPRLAPVAGRVATAAVLPAAAATNIAAHTADAGDRAADQYAAATGLTGPSASASAEAAARMERGERPHASATASRHEREVQGEMARAAAARRPIVAPSTAPDPLVSPARAADVRAGQVDAAGRRTGAFPGFTPLGAAESVSREEQIRRAVLGG